MKRKPSIPELQSHQVPIGSIPRVLTVNVYGENTRKCQPGDVVRIGGVYLPIIQKGWKGGSALSQETFLEAWVSLISLLTGH